MLDFENVVRQLSRKKLNVLQSYEGAANPCTATYYCTPGAEPYTWRKLVNVL